MYGHRIANKNYADLSTTGGLPRPRKMNRWRKYPDKARGLLRLRTQPRAGGRA